MKTRLRSEYQKPLLGLVGSEGNSLCVYSSAMCMCVCRYDVPVCVCGRVCVCVRVCMRVCTVSSLFIHI